MYIPDLYDLAHVAWWGAVKTCMIHGSSTFPGWVGTMQALLNIS